jgi:hypothetical protein
MCRAGGETTTSKVVEHLKLFLWVKCNRAIWTHFHIFIAPIWNYSSIQITNFYTTHPNSHESSENSLLSNFQLIYVSITWQEGMREGMSLSTIFSYCAWDVLGRVLFSTPSMCEMDRTAGSLSLTNSLNYKYLIIQQLGQTPPKRWILIT